jgi:hypothetical protein
MPIANVWDPRLWVGYPCIGLGLLALFSTFFRPLLPYAPNNRFAGNLSYRVALARGSRPVGARMRGSWWAGAGDTACGKRGHIKERGVPGDDRGKSIISCSPGYISIIYPRLAAHYISVASSCYIPHTQLQSYLPPPFLQNIRHLKHTPITHITTSTARSSTRSYGKSSPSSGAKGALPSSSSTTYLFSGQASLTPHSDRLL